MSLVSTLISLFCIVTTRNSKLFLLTLIPFFTQALARPLNHETYETQYTSLKHLLSLALILLLLFLINRFRPQSQSVRLLRIQDDENEADESSENSTSEEDSASLNRDRESVDRLSDLSFNSHNNNEWQWDMDERWIRDRDADNDSDNGSEHNRCHNCGQPTNPTVVPSEDEDENPANLPIDFPQIEDPTDPLGLRNRYHPD